MMAPEAQGLCSSCVTASRCQPKGLRSTKVLHACANIVLEQTSPFMYVHGAEGMPADACDSALSPSQVVHLKVQMLTAVLLS